MGTFPSIEILYGIPIGLSAACICAMAFTSGHEESANKSIDKEENETCVLGCICCALFFGLPVGFYYGAWITGTALICACFGFIPIMRLLTHLRRTAACYRKEEKRKRQVPKDIRFPEIYNFLRDLDGSNEEYCQYYDIITRSYRTVKQLKFDPFRTKALLKAILSMPKRHFDTIMNKLFPISERRNAVFGYIRELDIAILDELAMICLEYYGKNFEWNEELDIGEEFDDSSKQNLDIRIHKRANTTHLYNMVHS